MDFHPVTGELWSTDNQVDGMGDDQPPGELNRITGPGQHFGFPYLGGAVRIPDYKDMEPPSGTVAPVVETIAHAADLGLLFYTGSKFPAKYKKGVFTAQHGSWNRTVPVGARVLFTPLNDDGGALAIRVPATDTAGASATQDFTVTVSNTVTAPSSPGRCRTRPRCPCRSATAPRTSAPRAPAPRGS